MRLATLVSVGLVIGVAAAPTADAASTHKLKRSPGVGDAASTFKFRGKKWQPSGLVIAEYYASAGSSQPTKTFTFDAGSSGRFIFRLTRPVSSAAFGLNQRMCFIQYDTRFGPRAAGLSGRRFRRCKRFYVEPPTARFWPSSGPPGTDFLFMTRGWNPGQELTLELTRPDGIVETYTDFDPARQGKAYIALGPPFDSVFVPKGGTYRLFPGDPGVIQGTYTALVTPAAGGAGVRTAVTVTPP